MGVKGSLAGTALRKAYVQFADVNVQKTLREVGVEATDANGNLRRMADVMRDIAVATKDLPTAERLAFMKDVFDVRGMMSGMSLTKDVKELNAFLAKLKDVSDQADATARAMDAGIGGSFRLFQSAVEGAMNATGEALNSTIKPMGERITAVINSFTKWIEANKGLVASIAVTAGSIAALGAALLTISTVSRVLSAGIGALSGVFGAFAGVASALAANGRTAAECYALGLDPAEATNDFRIVSIDFEDGKSKVEWEPKVNRWTGAEIQVVLKGAESLDGVWHEVDKASEECKAKFRFLKVVVELKYGGRTILNGCLELSRGCSARAALAHRVLQNLCGLR